MYRFSLLLLISFFFIACQNTSSPEVSTALSNEPAWIYQPCMDGKIGAIGSAMPHFKGKAAQRRLAISRGLDELSQQSGVNIQSTIKRNEKRSGDITNSSAEVFTIQNSANETIKAHIEDIWVEPRTKEIFIWLVAD